MPSLRFVRDKRGYETTLLVHTDQHQGRPRQRLLYWFRTPPGVKVGRPALDAAAIRSIEAHNPDIAFDWPAILQAQPLQAPPEDPRARRRTSERRKPARKPAAAAPASPQRSQGNPPAPIAAPQPRDADAISDTPPEAPPFRYPLDEAQLDRLRARYRELLTRIAERGGDAERLETLRARAEALNPDAWGTEEDARRGLDEFEVRLRDLRAALGLRRRSRGGGRAHRSILGPS